MRKLGKFISPRIFNIYYKNKVLINVGNKIFDLNNNFSLEKIISKTEYQNFKQSDVISTTPDEHFGNAEQLTSYRRFSILGLNLYGFLYDKYGILYYGGDTVYHFKTPFNYEYLKDIRKEVDYKSQLNYQVDLPTAFQSNGYIYFTDGNIYLQKSRRIQILPGILMWLFDNSIIANLLYSEVIHKSFLSGLNYFTQSIDEYKNYFNNVYNSQNTIAIGQFPFYVSLNSNSFNISSISYITAASNININNVFLNPYNIASANSKSPEYLFGSSFPEPQLIFNQLQLPLQSIENCLNNIQFEFRGSKRYYPNRTSASNDYLVNFLVPNKLNILQKQIAADSISGRGLYITIPQFMIQTTAYASYTTYQLSNYTMHFQSLEVPSYSDESLLNSEEKYIALHKTPVISLLPVGNTVDNNPHYYADINYGYYFYTFSRNILDISIKNSGTSELINLNYVPFSTSTVATKYLQFKSGYRFHSQSVRTPSLDYILSNAVQNYIYNQFNDVATALRDSISKKALRINKQSLLYVFQTNNSSPNYSVNRQDKVFLSYDYQNYAYPDPRYQLQRQFRSFPTEQVRFNIDGTQLYDQNLIYVPYQSFSEVNDDYTFHFAPFAIQLEGINSSIASDFTASLLGRYNTVFIEDSFIQNRYTYLSKIFFKNYLVDTITKLPPHNVANKLEQLFLKNPNTNVDELYLIQQSVHHGAFYKERKEDTLPFLNGEYYTTGVLYKFISFDISTKILTVKVEDIITLSGIGVLPVNQNSNSYYTTGKEYIIVNDDFNNIVKIGFKYDTTNTKQNFQGYDLIPSVKTAIASLTDGQEKKIGQIGTNDGTNLITIITEKPDIFELYSALGGGHFYAYGSMAPSVRTKYFEKQREEDVVVIDVINDFKSIGDATNLIYASLYNDATIVLLKDMLNLSITDNNNYYTYQEIASNDSQFLILLDVDELTLDEIKIKNDFQNTIPYEINLNILNISNTTLNLKLTIHSDLYLFKTTSTNSINISLSPGQIESLVLQAVLGEVGDAIITIAKQ